jgi:hypothetical protein
MRRFLKLWCTGACVAAILFGLWYLHNTGMVPGSSPNTLLSLGTLTYVLWPSSLMPMSLSGKHPLQTLLVVSLSLSVNGFIYAGVGYGLWKVLSSVLARSLTTGL